MRMGFFGIVTGFPFTKTVRGKSWDAPSAQATSIATVDAKSTVQRAKTQRIAGRVGPDAVKACIGSFPL